MNREILTKRLTSISGDIRRLSETVNIVTETDIARFPEVYEARSVEAARRAEWVALRLRHLVYATTNVWKWDDYLPRAADTMGISIEQREGIYELTLPGLMPKRKSRKGMEYLFDPLVAALEQYVKSHRVARFSHSTVCFVMVYDRTLSERRIRDYDNLKLKMALDVIASFLMKSDGGLLCDAYHSTELGETDCTKVFVMDSKCYPRWYSERQERLESAINSGR